MTREEFLANEIQTYRKKIEYYQAMIAEWEKEIGHSSPTPSNGAPSEPTTGSKKPVVGDPLSMIHGMVFFGKSQPEAAKAFLEMVHYPLTTQQILDGIVKGGVAVGGKDPKQNLYTILDRSQEFTRVRKGTWALVGWPGVPKKTADDLEKENSKTVTEKASE